MPFPVRVTDNVATARRLNVASRGYAAFLETLWPTKPYSDRGTYGSQAHQVTKSGPKISASRMIGADLMPASPKSKEPQGAITPGVPEQLWLKLGRLNVRGASGGMGAATSASKTERRRGLGGCHSVRLTRPR